MKGSKSRIIEVSCYLCRVFPYPVGTRLKIFFNKYVREGKKLPSSAVVLKEFKQYFEAEGQKAVDKLKTPKGKASKMCIVCDGLDLIKQIRKIYDRNEVETKILAASIRNPIDVPNAFGMGADVCTIPYDIFNRLFEHCLTTAGLEAFNKDWASLQEMLYDDE